MRMSIGKFKGQPVQDVKTSYLFWLLSQDNIRFHRWPMCLGILKELSARFTNFDGVATELNADAAPVEYWKTVKHIDRKKRVRAEKLQKLEVRRAEERRERITAHQARILQQRQARQEAISNELRDIAASRIARHDYSELGLRYRLFVPKPEAVSHVDLARSCPT